MCVYVCIGTAFGHTDRYTHIQSHSHTDDETHTHTNTQKLTQKHMYTHTLTHKHKNKPDVDKGGCTRRACTLPLSFKSQLLYYLH